MRFPSRAHILRFSSRNTDFLECSPEFAAHDGAVEAAVLMLAGGATAAILGKRILDSIPRAKCPTCISSPDGKGALSVYGQGLGAILVLQHKGTDNPLSSLKLSRIALEVGRSPA